MLYIMHGDFQKTWYAGEKVNCTPEGIISITEIQADGAEFEAIKKYFENVPYAKHARVQRWFGDDAKLIVAGLMSTYGSVKDPE